MKIRGIKILFFLSLMFINYTILSGQDKISPYIQVKYLKDTDNKRSLQTALTYSRNRMELPLPGMKITFYTGTDKRKMLETAITNDKGIADIQLNDENALSAEKNGSWTFSSEFAGNDTIQAGSSEISITDVNLRMTLSEADSVKTISLSAGKVSRGVESPVGGEKVMIYVPRMFSLLPLGEVTLDDSGSGTIEFPSDLPGDKEGNVTIIARFEENPTFGNVERRETLKWGLPSEYSVPSTHRALWTKGAPKWMIYTLSVLLTGVWAHYLYAIISLIRIRINAKRQEELDNYGKVI
jgi:hypothetical protein